MFWSSELKRHPTHGDVHVGVFPAKLASFGHDHFTKTFLFFHEERTFAASVGCGRRHVGRVAVPRSRADSRGGEGSEKKSTRCFSLRLTKRGGQKVVDGDANILSAHFRAHSFNGSTFGSENVIAITSFHRLVRDRRHRLKCPLSSHWSSFVAVVLPPSPIGGFPSRSPSPRPRRHGRGVF